MDEMAGLANDLGHANDHEVPVAANSSNEQSDPGLQEAGFGPD
jgi:hypothetical protein